MKQTKEHWTPLYTVQDVNGQTWDIHKEQATQVPLEFKLLKGFPTGKNPTNSSYKSLMILLTPALASFIKQNTAVDAAQALGISVTIVQKFRRTLRLSCAYLVKDEQWLLHNQKAILCIPLAVLKDVYMLSKAQVERLTAWVNEVNMPQNNDVDRFTLEEYKKHLYTANTLKDLILEEPIPYNQNENKPINRLFTSQTPPDQIIKQLINVTEQLIQDPNRCCTKKALDKRLLEHQDILLSSLPLKEIAKELDIAVSTVVQHKAKVRKMLNLPKDNTSETRDAWCEQHYDILMSTELSLKEIEARLGKPQDELVYLRRRLRKKLNIKPKKKDEWILAHQRELQYLADSVLIEKYNLTQSKINSYRRKLNKLLLKENESELLQQYWLGGDS